MALQLSLGNHQDAPDIMSPSYALSLSYPSPANTSDDGLGEMTASEDELLEIKVEVDGLNPHICS